MDFALIVVAAAAVIPILRPLFHSKFRRIFPRAAILFATAILGYWASLAAVAVLQPALLPVAALASCAAGVWIWWRSRPDYGAGRKLPPGSLTLLPLGPWLRKVEA
jgi:hypothetical protein